MTILFLSRLARLTAIGFIALVCWGSPLHAQSIAVMVNGEPITNYDIEQRSKLMLLSTHKSPTRQEVINDLIDEKVKIREGKKYSVDPTSSDVDASFANMSSRMRLSPEQLTQSLASKGIRTNTLRSRIKADIVWGSLVRGRFKDSLLVGEKDVESAMASKGDEKQDAESFEYQMRPVVLIVPRGAAPAVMEARRKEADALRERVQTCAEASNVFNTMQNATIRDTVVKTSADLPPPLRELLDKTPIGHLTPPEVTRQGVEMVALCGKKTTTVDTPKKKEIRDKMFSEKFQKRSKSYLEEVRKAAMIEYRGSDGKKTEKEKTE